MRHIYIRFFTQPISHYSTIPTSALLVHNKVKPVKPVAGDPGKLHSHPGVICCILETSDLLLHWQCLTYFIHWESQFETCLFENTEEEKTRFTRLCSHIWELTHACRHPCLHCVQCITVRQYANAMVDYIPWFEVRGGFHQNLPVSFAESKYWYNLQKIGLPQDKKIPPGAFLRGQRGWGWLSEASLYGPSSSSCIR